MPVSAELITFDQFERLPDEPGKAELLDGELIQMPPAKRQHGELTERLYLRLRQLIEELKAVKTVLKAGAVHIEMGYRIGRKPDSWLQPDVSVTHLGQAGEDYYEGAPLIAVEVISESNTAAKVEAKIQKYFSGGAHEVWVVYPGTRRVLTHYADRDEVSVGRNFIRSGALPGVTAILLTEIW